MLGFLSRVPEIGEAPSDKNVLFTSDQLPAFNNFTIENCIAAIANNALDLEKQIRNIEENISNSSLNNAVEDIFNPIERLQSSLEATWGVAKTLYFGNSTLMPTKSYLTIHERARRATSLRFNSYPIWNSINKLSRYDICLYDFCGINYIL